ncbi:ABC transporter substrate-binding protein [Dehalococcoidia bacterium]|nr:ABC transporter substrate-binding protein [Dehalococcoidia bacterium]
MSACSSSSPTMAPISRPTDSHARNPLSGVPGILDPSNLSWPREVQGLNGRVIIHTKPQRIITASVGHDEVTLALVARERLVGVGGATKDDTYSNVASIAHDIPTITRDPETIIAQDPDVVVTSPFFNVDGIYALERSGITVVQTALKHDLAARTQNILLMGYIYGEEARALAFADEVRSRFEAITLQAKSLAQNSPHRVLVLTQYSDKIWTAGGNSTEGSIINAVGGVNAAEKAGINGNQTTNWEGVIAMTPDVILIPQPFEFGATEFRQQLLNNEALAELPAVKTKQVFIVDSKLFTTLSFWNIRGAEELAKILWPTVFLQKEVIPFSRVD